MKHLAKYFVASGLSLLVLSSCESNTSANKNKIDNNKSNIPAKYYSLKYAHFMPASSWQNKTLFKDWADAIKKSSGDKLNITIFPAQTLGKAPAGYDNAKNGITDIAWTVQGYTANRFPLSQIVELPGLFKTAEVGSCAFQKLYDSGALDNEYKETHVLYVHTHGVGHISTKKKPISKLSDFKGLKIRRPTAIIGKLLKELGAEPVGMPAPRIYESVQHGSIDGFMLPWEAVTGFRADEVTDHHTEFGFYSLAFVATMNKNTYQQLPDQIKKVIDANSGMKWALIAGRGFDKGDIDALPKIKKSGTIHQIDPKEKAKWVEAGKRVTKAYLAELDGNNLPGTQTYDTFKKYVSECEAKFQK